MELPEARFTAQPPMRPTYVRWCIAGLLSCAALIAYLDRIIISNVVVEFREKLALTDFQAGCVLAAFVLGYGLMQVPTGRLGDRVAIRFALPGIVIAWSLMTGLTAVAGTFALLLLVRFAFGVAQAGVFPFSIPALRRWFPIQTRGSAQSVVVTGTRIGAVAATLAAPLLLSAGWEKGFVACALAGALWTAVFIWWFRDRPEQHPHANAQEVELIGVDPPLPVESTRIPLGTLLANKNIWGMSAGQFFGAMGYYLYITWFPTYLREQYGFNMAEAGLWTTLPHLGGFLGVAIGGRVVDQLFRSTGSLRWSRKGVWLAGKAGCGALFVLAATLSDAQAAVIIIALAAALSDMASPASWAAVIDVGRRNSGVVFGIQNTVGAVGAFLCPLFVPLVTNAAGWGAVLPVFAAIFFACAASWLWVDAGKPIREPGETTQNMSSDELPPA